MSLGLRPPRRSKSMAMHSVTVQGCKGGLAACHIQWIVSHIISMVRAPPRRRAARTGRRLPACRRGGNTRMRLSARRERSRARNALCRIVRSCRGARPVSRRRFMKKSGHNLRVPTTSDAPKDAMYHRGGSGATDPNRTADASRRNRTRNERLRGASARGPSSIILRRCRVRTRQNTK